MSAPRIPNSEKYWERKNKKPLINIKGETTYKNVMLYTHDDLDGIMSAQLIKKYLLNKGFNIIGYGIVNYQEGWNYTTLNKDYINVSVDFAGYHSDLDVYVDHHIGDLPSDRKDYAIKTATGSAFEGITLQYGIQHDSMLLHPIDMVDSAKYKHYDVDITDVIKYDWGIINNSKQPKLTFTGMVNQFIKRSDHNTLIEVIHNCVEPSIYNIYLKFKEFYRGNNLDKKGNDKEFLEDGKWRIKTMSEKTRGYGTSKKVYLTQQDFLNDCYIDGKIELKKKGYQIFGNLAFIPSGVWANGIRARAILEDDIRSGIIPANIVHFILLQYGNTLQIVAYDSINQIGVGNLPILKNGNVMNNLGVYMENLLEFFKTHLGYVDPSTYVSTIGDEITVAGGHLGIGTVSNLCSTVKDGKFSGQYLGMKYIDLVKNKIIQDMTRGKCVWNNLDINWSTERDFDKKEIPFNHRVKMVDDIRTSGDQKTNKQLVAV